MRFLVAPFAALTLALSSTAAFADTKDTFNVQFSPLAFALGMLNGKLDYKLTKNITLGPSFMYWDIDVGDIEVDARGVGLTGTYYFNEAYANSWWASSGLSYMNLKVADEDPAPGTSSDTATIDGMFLNFSGGYHWFWGNSFNLQLGAGVSFNTIGDFEIKNTNGTLSRKKNYPSVQGTWGGALGFTF